MEPFGFIHYHLFCPLRIKYFILLTNIKTLKCSYECIYVFTNVFISFYVVNQYHMRSAKNQHD